MHQNVRLAYAQNGLDAVYQQMTTLWPRQQEFLVVILIV